MLNMLADDKISNNENVRLEIQDIYISLEKIIMAGPANKDAEDI